jgi:orotate phosphoribosyltransferase
MTKPESPRAAAAGGDALAQEFVQFSVEAGVLRFGDFTTKAGRKSPYFFNTGLFDDGAKLQRLGEFYARRLLACSLEFDMLFGPAYKGITLAAAVAIGLARHGRNVGYAYNRKEAKAHGEGGTLVGAPVRGRVLVIDDVITDGASKREAAELIRAAGATPVGVAITMDRQERARDEGADRRSGVQYVEQELGLRVVSIATLADLMQFLATTGDATLAANAGAVAAYRARYGIDQ